MLDVVGFDTTVLAEIADFVRPWRTANTNGSRTP